MIRVINSMVFRNFIVLMIMNPIHFVLAFETGCPEDAPLCSCVLEGHDICTDPDGDGILSLYDNCRYVNNPGQVNCDGDSSGDACDSENVTITQFTERLPTEWEATDTYRCVSDPSAAGGSIDFRKYRYTNITQTIEVRRYCGPSSRPTETQVVNEDRDTNTCWQYFGENCGRPTGSDPVPYCQSAPWPVQIPSELSSKKFRIRP